MELGLDADFLDNLLKQVPPNEVERIMDKHAPTPHRDMGNQQRGTGSPSLLPDTYLADTALRNIYVFRAEFGDPFKTPTGGITDTDLVVISRS